MPSHPVDRRTFLRLVPKAEIHLHLEGTVELPTLQRIAGDTGAGRERLASLYVHRDFPAFLQNFRRLCEAIRGPGDFALITTELSRRLQGENVRYAEVFCSSIIFARARGLPADEILHAVSDAARAGERHGGPRLRFLLDGVRQFGVRGMEEVVSAALACRRYDVIGVGLGGDETSFPTAGFAAPYREARRHGLRTTVHAGEFDGARSVWEAMEILEAERIGHGVRACEDEELVRVLSRRGVPLECCPTSNLRTGTVRDWGSHPMIGLHRAGVAVTVSSDDPALFGTTLVGEWEALIDRLGLSPEETLEIGRRTVRSTFLPADEKAALETDMLRVAAANGVSA